MPSSRLSASSPSWHWPALLLLPAILTAVVPDWMYSQTDYIDAWVYHGFFRHLEIYSATMFPQTYYGTRLGWIVPGYAAYHLFSPAVANVVLHLTFYCTAVYSLYLIVRRIAGGSNALFTAFAFGLYVPVFRALGSDYVDSPVITYALLAVTLGARGIEASRPWMTMASGVAVGAMLNSNVGSAFLLPTILLWLLPRRNTRRWASLLVQACLWCGGIVLCTTVLVLISVMAGGEWDFFLLSFRWMRSQGWSNPWDVAGLSWMQTAPWVFLPVSAGVGAWLLLLVRGRGDRLTTGQRRALASLGICFTVFVAWDFVGPGALLYWPFYASWLLPWSFIAIGAMLAPGFAHGRTELATLIVCVSILAWSLLRPGLVQLPVTGFAGLGLTAVLLALAVLIRTAPTGRLMVAVVLACIHGWLSLTTFYTPADDRADGFRAIDRGIQIMERYVTADQPRFLLTPPRTLGHYVQGLTSVYLWGYTIASDSFPEVTPQQAARIEPGTTVVVIAEDRDAAATFDEVFAPYGLSGQVQGAERIDTRHGPLYLTFFEARARPPTDDDRSASPPAPQPPESHTAIPTPARP